MTWIGPNSANTENLSTSANWVEKIESLTPINLFQSQLARRAGSINTPPPDSEPDLEPYEIDPVTLTPTVSPLPWLSTKNRGEKIRISRLRDVKRVEIITTRGALVNSIPANDGEAVWDLTNHRGESVSSGIYLYIAPQSDGPPLRGRLVIIR